MDDQLENKAQEAAEAWSKPPTNPGKTSNLPPIRERQHQHLLNQYNLYSQLPNTTNHHNRHPMTLTAGQGNSTRLKSHHPANLTHTKRLAPGPATNTLAMPHLLHLSKKTNSRFGRLYSSSCLFCLSASPAPFCPS